jgi:hypothetical protein
LQKKYIRRKRATELAVAADATATQGEEGIKKNAYHSLTFWSAPVRVAILWPD